MKSLLSFACLLIAFAIACSANEKVDKVAEKFMTAIKKNGGDCFEQSGLSEEDIEAFKDIKEEDVEKTEVKENLNKFGCLMACIHKNMGTMEDTAIDLDKLNEKIDEEEEDEEMREQLKKIAVECVEEVKELNDSCQVGLGFTVCTFKKLIA